MSGPWSFDEARSACRDASAAQAAAEDALKAAYREFAQAEEAYRTALAVEIVTQHDKGVAWSVAPDLARGDTTVAALRRKRDIAEGMKDAFQNLAWRRSADRKDAQRFAQWSQARELAEFRGEAPVG